MEDPERLLEALLESVEADPDRLSEVSFNITKNVLLKQGPLIFHATTPVGRAPRVRPCQRLQRGREARGGAFPRSRRARPADFLPWSCM